MLNAGEFNSYSQGCFLNPTCISPSFGWVFISNYTLQTAYWSQKDSMEEKYVMETENENCCFHVPQELTFEYLNYLDWVPQ